MGKHMGVGTEREDLFYYTLSPTIKHKGEALNSQVDNLAS